MYLVSTSKKTILSDFADLETKSTFVHSNAEPTDFQFNARRSVFVEVNKKAGLAVMRIKQKQHNAPEIQRLRKLTIENANSVCCAKTTSNHIAIGQSSGYVKLFDFRSAELIHRYLAGQKRDPVIHLDYNCTDEYIAAVLEMGIINIYGTKTKQKLESVNIDDHSYLARFHPSKRFQLAIASFNGAVNVYDMQSKRTLFHNNKAHNAPCRDVAMCSTQPSLLVSVGFDCNINIFDIRRKSKSPVDRLTNAHPMSTVALSECGTYFCGGNLKGELIAYDMRSTKTPLGVRAVHDGCAVTRVAFVPIPIEDQQYSFCSSNNATMDGIGGERASLMEQKSSDEQQLAAMSIRGYGKAANLSNASSLLTTPATFHMQRDSFCDFLDAAKERGWDRMSTSSMGTARRDSFDWDALRTNIPDSEDQPQRMCFAVSPLDSTNYSTVDSLQQTLSGPLRDRSNISADAKLKQIAETDEHDELHEEQSVNCSAASSNAGSDKENPPLLAAVDQKRLLRMLPASRNSTPQHAVAGTGLQAGTPKLEPQQHQHLPQTSSSISLGDGNADMRRELAELRDIIEQRFGKLESDLKWANEMNKFQTFKQLSTFLHQQSNTNQEIRHSLDLLLQTDAFFNEFSRVQLENEVLRGQVQQLLNGGQDEENPQA